MPEGDWFTAPMLWLAAQAAAAVLSIRIFARSVAPNIRALMDHRAATDAIGPLALALPLIAAGFRTDHQVAVSSGWMALAAPIAVGWLALGAALLVQGVAADREPPHDGEARPGVFAAIAWSLTGGFLLLLGAAHHLTIWSGQCAFAAGAVLLWMNSPELPRERPPPAELRAGNGLTFMLLLSLVQGVALAMTPADLLPVAGALAVAHAAIIASLTAALAGTRYAVRLGGWTAALGVLMGLGAISLRHLLPRAFAVFQGDFSRPPIRIAHGFGEYAIEAMALLLLAGAAITIDRLRGAPARLISGTVAIVAAALLCGWRLAYS